MSSASDMRERVRIEKQVSTADGYGGRTISWTEHATVFAEVKPVQGTITERERFIADQRNAHSGYRITVRLRADVTAAMRVIWKTHTLLIHSVHERDAYLSLLCYEENL